VTDYDANADFAGSLDVAYTAIRELVARGGAGWTPKLNFTLDANGHQRREENGSLGAPSQSNPGP